MLQPQYSHMQGQQHHAASSSSGNSSSGRMALVASSIGGAAYALNNGDDKETGNGFEFTRRKRWPQLLLQELVGSALFCLKPVATSMDGRNGRNGSGWGWKMIYVSPSVGDMLGQKPSQLENRDFFDLVFAPDHPQLQTLFSTIISPHATLMHQPRSNSTVTTSSSDDPTTPTPPSSSSTGRSHTAYVRMLTSEVEPGTDKGPVVWEIRAHATGLNGGSTIGAGSFGLAGSGTVVPQGTGEAEDAKGRAVWIMGRKIGEVGGEAEGNGQSLDAFLELKLENERLREELLEFQVDLDEYDEPRYVEPVPSRPPPAYHPDLSSEPDSSSAEDSSASSSPPPRPYMSSTIKPELSRPKPAKPGRPPKDPAAREKKRLKKAALAGAGGGEGEGLHVCVTCGRTDSPEWRKGPLGPKTLCNACGLRWAKRNSTQPTRKERKAAAEKKAN